MALFGSKKNTDAAAEAPAKEKKAKAPAAKPAKAAKKTDAPAGGRDLSHVLRHPRITEKATMVGGEGSSVYVFDVSPRATKHDVAEAIKLYYKATPAKVNVTKVPSKRVRVRGKMGVKSGGRKAYVYLKKGETIEIV